MINLQPKVPQGLEVTCRTSDMALQRTLPRSAAPLRPGADLIVATVGRLYDFVRAGVINVEARVQQGTWKHNEEAKLVRVHTMVCNDSSWFKYVDNG